MPDRRYTYKVDIDVNQARQAAQQLRRVFEQELRTVNVGGGVTGTGTMGRGMAGGVGPNIPGLLGGALGFTVAGMGVGMLARSGLTFAKELSDLNREARMAEQGLKALVGTEEQVAQRTRIVQEMMGGTVTKIEAMQQATQLAALGFADTTQEMERFIRASQGASVATGHNTDYITQQLTLAIANQSMIRLDQLGLGVSEVKGRIQELKDAHADWSQEMLYQEAVLGRLEEKYGTLATLAAENASGLVQFTAALTDLKTAASGAGSGVDTVTKAAASGVRATTDAVERGNTLSEVYEKIGVTGLDAAAAQARFLATLDQADSLEEYNAILARTNALYGEFAIGRQTTAPGDVAPRWGFAGGYDPLSGYGQGGTVQGYWARQERNTRLMRPVDGSNQVGTFGYGQFWGQLAAEQAQENSRLAKQGADKAARDWERAADQAQNAWEKAASEFESRLSRVPGLFGTSETTDAQMELAKMGVGQNFADNYLRRLTDEVMNGKDWAGVDLATAARLGGIDQGLDPKAQLALFRQKWENSSLFSNKDALSLIDQGAVRDALAEQQRSEQGRQNLLQLFGVDAQSLEQNKDKLLGAGVNMTDEIYNGFSSQAGEKDWAGAILNALMSQISGMGGGGGGSTESLPPAPLGDISGALGIYS